MTGKVRRALLAFTLLAVTGAGLSACAVYTDGPRHGWNDRRWHDYDRDHYRDRYDRRW